MSVDLYYKNTFIRTFDNYDDASFYVECQVEDNFMEEDDFTYKIHK